MMYHYEKVRLKLLIHVPKSFNPLHLRHAQNANFLHDIMKPNGQISMKGCVDIHLI